MPDLLLPGSPVAPGRSPVRVHYRERGAGSPILILHGGWGYAAYPFDSAFDALAPRHRVVAPDRVGYGRSDRVAALPPGFHALMAEETMRVMDALGIASAALWGHSDGAVIAAWAAILHPERVSALVLEALHFFAAKTSSIPFFETGVATPERFGPAVVEALARDHGESWRDVIAAGGRAWLEIIRAGQAGRPDLYAGRLGEVRAPVLLLHGDRDPRTEPGELDAARRALPAARAELLDASHSPHTSAVCSARCVAAVAAFLDAVGSSDPLTDIVTKAALRSP
jgi:pimeloyl-ACP methyl ester carboxylesterase